MPLNKQNGNMYDFVSHTWNVIKGKCFHDCRYCYMKRFPQAELKFDETEFKTNLGAGHFIFIGSSNDICAANIPDEWIKRIFDYCQKYDNKYLFQSKNPGRFIKLNTGNLNDIYCTTIETNRNYNLSRAPGMQERASAIKTMGQMGFKTAITIEPVIDFDLDPFLSILEYANPGFVNIGADSGGNNLPEPSAAKINTLIEGLNKFTKIRIKRNLGRMGIKETGGEIDGRVEKEKQLSLFG